jgi:hypothetical protein
MLIMKISVANKTLGLPYDGSGFLSQLPQGLSKLFTLYLTPWSVGRAALTLGSIDATKYTGKSYIIIISLERVLTQDQDKSVMPHCLKPRRDGPLLQLLSMSMARPRVRSSLVKSYLTVV